MDPSIYFANPEEAVNFEVGVKKTFSNGYFNMSLFHMAVEGYQSNLFIGTGFNLVNIGEETHKGIEIDSLFFLSEDFVFTFAASYIRLSTISKMVHAIEHLFHLCPMIVQL